MVLNDGAVGAKMLPDEKDKLTVEFDRVHGEIFKILERLGSRLEDSATRFNAAPLHGDLLMLFRVQAKLILAEKEFLGEAMP
jgi:hypothetical protein